MIDNDDYSIHFDNNIMIVVYKCKILNLEIAKNIIRDRVRLSKNQDQFIFVDSLKIGYWTSESRSFMGKKENLAFIASSAILIKSPLLMNLLSWFLSMFSVSSPTKFFKGKDEAIAWLIAQQKKPNHSQRNYKMTKI